MISWNGTSPCWQAAAKRPEKVESSPRRVSTRNVVKMQESPQVDGQQLRALHG